MRVIDTKTLSVELIEICVHADGLDECEGLKIVDAAQRIDDLAALAKEMAGMLAHDRALPDGCKDCAMQKRLAELGVVV